MLVEKLCITRRVTVGLIVAALSVLLSAPNIQAASVVIDEAGMNAIFSQASFGTTPISIRFNPAQEIVAPQLLNINTVADLQAVYNLAPSPAPTVNALFVDRIDACGEIETANNGFFAGCAQLPGNILVEASDFARMAPAVLMAHELGHNLNLQHDLLGSFTNLMSPLFPHGPDITEEQAATILQSPLVQTDPAGQRFIAITPIALVATPIPEPSTLPLLGGAFLVFLTMKKTRRASDLTEKHLSEDRR
jgi:hypothetical protein